MKWTTDSIEELILEFKNQRLSKSKWNHHAHLIICAYYLKTFEYYEAIQQIRTKIIQHNFAQGIPNTVNSGYHETLTLFWTWVVYAFLKERKEPLDVCVHELLNSPYSKKYLPFFFYSEDWLFSNKSRATWIDPDQKPLDHRLIESEFVHSIWYGEDEF